METWKKYRHVGYSHLGVPEGWKHIVEDTIKKIEREMWPRWIPLFIKRMIHYLATGNSVVYIKSKFWNKIRSKLTNNQIVFDIKDKYATLRIYGSFNNKIYSIIEKAEDECENTCEDCSSTDNVRATNTGWVYNLCPKCIASREIIESKPF